MSPRRTCPECRGGSLEPASAPSSRADVCVRCGGLWFEAGTLATAIRLHDPDAVPPGALAATAPAAPGPASIRQCPTCRVAMNGHLLSEANPLRLEICPECAGVWLPQGELARAQAGHQLAPAEDVVGAETTWAHWFFQFLAGLPVEFNIAPRRTPVVSYGLIVLNTLLFQLFAYWGLLFEGPAPDLALHPDQLAGPGWWAGLLTSQFVHAGTLHLLGNMYFLWIVGDNVEDVLGRLGFLAFYLAAGAAGGIAYSLMTDQPGIAMVGASGAISGILGAYAIWFRRSRLTFMLVFWQFKLATPVYVAIWAAFNLAARGMELPGIAWEAHLGGLAFGLAGGALLFRPLLRDRPLLRLLGGGR